MPSSLPKPCSPSADLSIPPPGRVLNLISLLQPHIGDEIWVRDTVNTNLTEGVLPVVSTGFAPGSIYGLTLFYVHGYFAACAILDPVRSLARSLF
jgi:hypothetical protein